MKIPSTLFHHVLTSSLFCFNCQSYEQTDRVPVGSLLSPMFANFFTEDLKELSLSKTAYKHMH